MLKSYKFRIYPNKEQEILINKTFGCVRFIYNHILADALQHFKDVGKSKIKTPASYKGEFDWLKEVDSFALCNAQLNVMSAYTRFFKKQNKPPKFHKKGNKDSYTTNNNQNNIRITHNGLKLPKLKEVMCVCHRWVKGTIKSCTISKTKSGKYFVSILTEQEDPINNNSFDSENIVGIDASMEHLAVFSDGKKANYPHYYRKHENRLVFLQNKLSKKEKKSKNYDKLRLKIAKLHEIISNCRKDFTQKLSAEIIQKYDVIVVEDINFQIMSGLLHLGKSVCDIGFGMFRAMLDYKTKWNFKELIMANKWYPSSKLCSSCGFKYSELKLSEREWQCPECNTIHDRDINAAINLMKYRTNATLGSNACGSNSESGKIGIMAFA